MAEKVLVETIIDPETSEVIHQVLRPRLSDNVEVLSRTDFSEPTAFLQGAVLEIPAKHEFRAHIHLERSRSFPDLRAQESWVVLSGQVEVDYFSESGVFIKTKTLETGDISISFKGGHGYRTLESSSLVYEFKSGPYEGQVIDKRFIG